VVRARARRVSSFADDTRRAGPHPPLARCQGSVVVMIRRKPSKLFHVIRVDTVTGKYEQGT